MKLIDNLPIQYAPLNLAIEEILFNSRENEPTVFFWQNAPSVIIGRNQDFLAEASPSIMCHKMTITPVRRMTGGGAVYHDLGNLNYSLMVNKRDYSPEIIINPILETLKDLNVLAKKSGRNDLVIDGKKFSGTAELVRDGKVLLHGTLLYNTDFDVMNKVLTPRVQKLKKHAVSSVHSRVTNLSEHINISLEELKLRIIDKLKKKYKIVFFDDLMEETWNKVFDLAKKKYLNHSWTDERTVDYCRMQKRAVDFSGGRLEANYILKDRKVSEIVFTGDFFSNENITELEEMITGKAIDELEYLDFNCDAYINGLRKEEFLELFEY